MNDLPDFQSRKGASGKINLGSVDVDRIRPTSKIGFSDQTAALRSNRKISDRTDARFEFLIKSTPHKKTRQKICHFWILQNERGSAN